MKGTWIIATALPLLALTGCAGAPAPAAGGAWRSDFDLRGLTLSTTGTNRYFILEPGFQTVLEGGGARLTVTVLEDTRTVAGVATRVVEEREERDGRVVEISSNYFAICRDTGDVFYFGEDVDTFRDGRLRDHAGAWRAGENGHRPGLMMPGRPEPGMRFQLEQAPGVAMDRAEIVSLSEVLDTPAGRFTDCLKVREGTALNPLEREYKIHAPGIGLIRDEDLLLTRHGFLRKQERSP